MGNITAHEEGNYTSTLIQPSKDMEPIFLFTFSLNVFLSITASLGNILILIALHKVSSLHPPTKLLFPSLAVTDLCVGLVSQPLFAVVLLYMSHSTDINSSVSYLVFTAANGSGFVFCEVSIMVSTAISVDRLLALLLGLRYRHVVTLWRVRAILICLWLVAISVALVGYFWSYRFSVIVVLNIVLVSLVISIFSYTNIFLKLRQHQAQVQQHGQQGQPNERAIPLNMAKYKKTVSSIAWVQLALVACYVPFGIMVALMNISGLSKTGQIVRFFVVTLLYLNSSLNPLLCCWKMSEVRESVKDTIRRFSCLSV